MSAPPFPCETEDNEVCWPCEMLVSYLNDPSAIDLTRFLPNRPTFHVHDPAFWREPGRLVTPPPGRSQEEQECPF